MWKETRSLTLGKQFLRNSMKTVAMVNSTSGTNRDTEMGPVHLYLGWSTFQFSTKQNYFLTSQVCEQCCHVDQSSLLAICTIQCILSTLAWVPIHTACNTAHVSHVSRPRVTCHLLGQLRPRVPHHGEVVYPVEAPPVQHGRGGVQPQLQPGQLRGVETGCST